MVPVKVSEHCFLQLAIQKLIEKAIKILELRKSSIIFGLRMLIQKNAWCIFFGSSIFYPIVMTLELQEVVDHMPVVLILNSSLFFI